MNYFLYFDPGLGAMIVQAIVAVAAGVILFSKNAMYKVKAFFGLLKKEDDTYDSIDIDEQDTDIHDEKK
ncbi:hypothetical protein ATE92_1773 [Ulvibacter sp. MAR_2010_11]|uniref:hypothetical protein n=1 Tax=Ulvibacter sp. MAR_2010_11 TaxID=1250229 RepID=UPI000C2C6A11|nr:hypothetical protein [Ulvibacter sp. MAR_2010_11]PKA83613.1 hypothetical protein ATE92_1773 [Ulvibacter sp. MAR_2010_11]